MAQKTQRNTQDACLLLGELLLLSWVTTPMWASLISSLKCHAWDTAGSKTDQVSALRACRRLAGGQVDNTV